MRTRTRRVVLATTLAGLALLASLAVASAHAGYARSLPAADAVVPAAPARVEVWFTEDLFRRAGANGLAVTGPGGASVDGGDTEFDPADRRHLTIPLKTGLGVGVYTVAWSTLATDGDSDSGRFTFTVDPHATPVPPASESVRPGNAVSPLAIELAILGTLLVAVLAVAITRRRR